MSIHEKIAKEFVDISTRGEAMIEGIRFMTDVVSNETRGELSSLPTAHTIGHGEDKMLGIEKCFSAVCEHTDTLWANGEDDGRVVISIVTGALLSEHLPVRAPNISLMRFFFWER
jgi:hypothetical protein